MYFDKSILSARFLNLYRKLHTIDYINRFLSSRVLDDVPTFSFSFSDIKKVVPKVSGRKQKSMKMIKISENGREYFSALTYDNHDMMPFLSRFYNFLGCQTFNIVIGAEKDEDDDENYLFYFENLLTPYEDLCQIGKEFNDNVGMFYILNNKNLMKQFLYRNVFVSLMGDKDAHIQNLFFNENLLFHIDLEELGTFSYGAGFFSGTSCYGLNKIDSSITLYFLFMDKIVRAETAVFSEIKNRLRIFQNNAFEIVKKLILFNLNLDIDTFRKQIDSEVINGSISMQNKMLLKVVSNVLDKYCQTVGLVDSKKVGNFIEYINSDLYLDDFTNNILDNIENNFYDITKAIIGLTQKDMDFLKFKDKETVKDLFQEANKTDFIKSVEDKRVEMLYYVARYNKIHKIFGLDETYENKIHETLKINKLEYVVSTDPKFEGYEWQVESPENRKTIADSMPKLTKVARTIKFCEKQNLNHKSKLEMYI